MLCDYVRNNIWSILYHIFHMCGIYMYVYVRVHIYIHIVYILVRGNVWSFVENGSKCEKYVKKKTLFPPMKYTVYLKRRKVKRHLKIAGAKENPTRAQHLSTFPTSRVRTAEIPTWTFQVRYEMPHYTSPIHSTVKPQMFSFFRCFSLYMILVDTFLFIFADS